MADLTQDEAIDRARAIDVDSYDVFLDLAAEPVFSRTEVRFRWLRPGVSTFAELRTQGVRGVTLDGVSTGSRYLARRRWLPCPGSPAMPAMPSPGTPAASACRAPTT